MRFRGVAFLLLGLSAPALALAQSPEDALLNECYTLRRAGRHAASLPRCVEAAERFPSGRSLAQLALTEMALERWAEAATHLSAALADRTHPWMATNRATVEEAFRIVGPHVGTLEVATNVAGATVSLPGTAPVPASSAIFARPGPVTVTVRAGDGRSVTREVLITAGQTTRERMNLPDAPGALAATAAGPPANAITAPPRSTPPALPSPTPTPPTSGVSTRRVLAWVAGGSALAGFGLALVAWRMREGVVTDYVAECPEATATAERCGSRWDDADPERAQWEAVTTVGLVAGGAFAVTAAILFATEPSRRPATTTWACAPSFGLAGGQCAVRF